jgi:hypothetical protein|nr:MAG TPA: hypothetical protein [Caudoviricetes sp.]
MGFPFEREVQLTEKSPRKVSLKRDSSLRGFFCMVLEKRLRLLI